MAMSLSKLKNYDIKPMSTLNWTNLMMAYMC